MITYHIPSLVGYSYMYKPMITYPTHSLVGYSYMYKPMITLPHPLSCWL